MTTYDDIKKARIDALRKKAEKLEDQSNALCSESMRLSAAVPFGQPILIGHHSESRHRNLIKKMRSKMSRSVELSRYAAETQRKADAAEHNRAISGKDSAAIQKLRAKIAGEEEAREFYKKANAIYKKARKSHSVDELTALVFTDLGATEREAETMLQVLCDRIKFYNPDYAAKQTRLYTYQASYSSKEIKRCKDRIAQLESLDKALSAKETIETDAGKLVHNTELKGLELHFPGKPSEEIRAAIKLAGWKWSSRQKLWYAKATQKAEEAAKQALATSKDESKEDQEYNYSQP